MKLKGDGFLLRALQLTDAQSLQKHADNVKVAAFLLSRFPSPYSLEDAAYFINLKLHNDPTTTFAIEIGGEACGVISIDMRSDIYSKTPLMGYWLGEQYWGRGIITNAIKLLTTYGFNTLDIICIQACVFHKNTASMRVLEKSGFVKQGILKRSIIKNGEVFDEYVYAIYPNL